MLDGLARRSVFWIGAACGAVWTSFAFAGVFAHTVTEAQIFRNRHRHRRRGAPDLSGLFGNHLVHRQRAERDVRTEAVGQPGPPRSRLRRPEEFCDEHIQRPLRQGQSHGHRFILGFIHHRAAGLREPQEIDSPVTRPGLRY